MEITLTHKGSTYQVRLHEPEDISLPLIAGEHQVCAWYLPPAAMEPVRMGDWVGDVRRGAGVNFRNVYFNPHGHCTHTETCGHIALEQFPVVQHFRDFFSFAQLVSIAPEQRNGDAVISRVQLENACPDPEEALIIRTLPNAAAKKTRNYSNTNPAYMDADAAHWLREKGVKHLLIDTPSVDREEDGGKLLSHHAFWNYPEQPRLDCTITELVFVPDTTADGLYFMNLQVAAFMNDAAPSRPLLFTLHSLGNV